MEERERGGKKGKGKGEGGEQREEREEMERRGGEGRKGKGERTLHLFSSLAARVFNKLTRYCSRAGRRGEKRIHPVGEKNVRNAYLTIF